LLCVLRLQSYLNSGQYGGSKLALSWELGERRVLAHGWIPRSGRAAGYANFPEDVSLMFDCRNSEMNF
jgi:hypothetical protein